MPDRGTTDVDSLSKVVCQHRVSCDGVDITSEPTLSLLLDQRKEVGEQTWAVVVDVVIPKALEELQLNFPFTSVTNGGAVLSFDLKNRVELKVLFEALLQF